MSETCEPPDLFDEEPWELEIAALLADLPEVEPPDGFIEAAIDHRPLHGGRAAVAVTGLCALAVSLIGIIGIAGPESVTPSLAQLATHHRLAAAATAAIGTSLDENRDPAVLDPAVLDPAVLDPAVVEAVRSAADFDGDTEVEVMPPGPEPLDLPTDFQHQGDLIVDDVRQLVYAHGDETVSVFTVEGQADFGALGSDGLRRFGDVEGWVDEAEGVLIVESGDRVVTIVGLDPGDIAQVLGDARPEAVNRWEALAGELTAQLGFPD